MKQIEITITTLSPIVLTAVSNAGVMTDSKDFISGTILRGVIAGQYIQCKKLGEHAETDSDFLKLFFEKLRFTDAYPTLNHKRSMPVPLSLQKNKNNESKHLKLIEDLLLQNRPLQGFKALKGFGVFDEKHYFPVEVKRSISLHMSRGSEAERIAGRSMDGNIFNYESLDANQEFKASIIGEESSLKQLLESLSMTEGRLEVRIGRSKYTGYGRCELSFGTVQDIPSFTFTGDTVYLRCDTPIVSEASISTTVEALMDPFIYKLNEGYDRKLFSLVTEKTIGNFESIEHFVAIWGAKRPSEIALVAGSIVAIKKAEPWTSKDMELLSQLCYEGVGARVEEGFGQLRLWIPKSFEEKSLGKVVLDKVSLSKETKKQVRAILETRCINSIQLRAKEDASHMAGLMPSVKHALASLENLLGPKINLEEGQKRFFYTIENDLREDKVFTKHLGSLKIDGKSLKNRFEEKLMPYSSQDFMMDMDKDLIAEVGFTLRDELVFYEYWLWLFRYARKAAKQGGAINE